MSSSSFSSDPSNDAAAVSSPQDPQGNNTTTTNTTNTNAHQEFWAKAWLFGNAESPYVETFAQRVPKEIGCALVASSLVSPLVTMIDKSIVQDISGASKFMKAVTFSAGEVLFTPGVFFRSLSFQLTLGVYFGTFAVANLADAWMDHVQLQNDHPHRKHYKIAAASVANISLLAWRDSFLAQQFGPHYHHDYYSSQKRGFAAANNSTTTTTSSTTSTRTLKSSLPWRSLGLFAARDFATMYSTFYLAPRAADYLRRDHGVDRNTAALSMALAIPTVTQFLTAPLHIHAMDYYYECPKSAATTAATSSSSSSTNTKTTTTTTATWSDRWQVIRKEWATVAFGRGMRILPAFGVGSFTNNKLREWFIRQPNENLLLTRRITKFFTKRPEVAETTSRGRVLKG